MRFLKYMLHPSEWYHCVRAIKIKREFKRCGNGVCIGKNFVVKEPYNIEIGDNTSFHSNCEVCTYETYYMVKTGYKPIVKIGSNVTFTENCSVSCLQRIEIGDGCLFGVNTFISDNSHGDNSAEELLCSPNERPLFSKGSITIGKNVWTGRNVCILANVSIGDNVIIGANSVVTKSFPSNCIIGGVPAHIIKYIM